MRPEDLHLAMAISDEILETTTLYNDVSTSDLQGIALAQAHKIIRMVRDAK